MAANHDEVLVQLRSHGLLVDHLLCGTTKPVRCKVEGEREKRGWYWLHEIQGKHGDLLIVGSYGINRGADHGTQKIELKKADLTPEQLASIRARLAEDKRKAEKLRAAEASRAALRAGRIWAKCLPTGDCDYLARKGVSAHGVRFSPSGAMVIPMLDVAGKIHGLQIIRPAEAAKRKRRLQKEYWPEGLVKKGHFHLIGSPTWIVLIAEGYATAASLHEATGLPVAVAFDANNLAPVATALRKRYKRVQILVCADDDALATCPDNAGGCGARISIELHPKACPSCGHEHRRTNAGVSSASAAALEASGAWVRPTFADQDARIHKFERTGAKLTDFNDVHAIEGLHVVRTQIEARITELGWSSGSGAARITTASGGGGDEFRPVATLDELLERYALVYAHGGTVFDAVEHVLLQLSDMRDACLTRDLHRAWAEHPDRRIVRLAEVGFDPTERDAKIRCNLWGGWPTTPKAGRCEKLLDLLRYMCAGERNAEEVFRWLLCWVAYPIQHPGAKIKSALVLHGPQGTGKSMFFEAVGEVYGEYGGIIGQHALEDKHNDWASRKLFLIADEVVARSDLYHVKNTLKSFITGKTVRINPKHIRAYDERNHCNIVFLSNEAMPVAIEEDDRRHAVLWTPEKLPEAFYLEVQAEIKAGGIAALHEYLLHLDLRDFTPDTKPPMTEAKRTLIGLSLDSTSRFYHSLMAGEIDGVRARPARSEDVYELYEEWCKREGLHKAPKNKLINVLDRRHKVKADRKRYMTMTGTVGPHGVLFLGKETTPPDGKSEGIWLGDQITAFKNAVDDYQGRSRG